MNKERKEYLLSKEKVLQDTLTKLNESRLNSLDSNDFDSIMKITSQINAVFVKLDFIQKRLAGFNQLIITVNDATVNPKDFIQ